MGIIRKQSLQSSIFIYIGFAIGALNNLILFPNEKYFTLAEFGLTKVLVDVSLLIAMLCTLGTYPAVVKFYPFYQSYLPKKKNDFPFLTLVTVSIGCLVFALTMPLFKDLIVRKYGERSPLFVQYFNLVYPLTISMAFLYLFEAYSWAERKTVLPAIARELMVRVLITALILCLMLGLLNFHQFINLYSLVYIPPVLFLLYNLIKNGELNFHPAISTVTKRLKKRIIAFSLFLFSGQALNILARTIDSIIITSKSPGGLQDTGIFTIATYFIALMEVPMRGMTGIAFAILAQAWKDKNLVKVFNIYKKTALNLLIAGLGIIGILLLSMPGVIAFLGDRFEPMLQVVLILGLSKLIDLGTGLNSHLLLTSKHWKIEFFTNIFLVMMAGLSNYVLVSRYGIVGSAVATLMSFVVYNTIRFLLIWKLFKMQPFGKGNLIILVAGVCCFFVAKLIPAIHNVFVDSVLRVVLFVILYSFLVIKLRVSEDINSIFYAALQRFTGFFSPRE